MSTMPAFQFYPADWQANPNLRRCTHEEKGIWIDVMCLLHDQAEYGVIRWPLDEIATAVGTTTKKMRGLITKGVLKGADKGECEPFIYTPRSGGKDGDPVTLIDAQSGPIWYSSRMVRDAYVRKRRGASTRFDDDGNQPQKRPPKPTPKPTPKPPFGDTIGMGLSDGPSSSSSSSKDSSLRSESSPPASQAPRGASGDGRGTRLPDDWTLTPALVAYAATCGYSEHETRFIAHRFENHWRAATGAKACKRDWDRTFQNWVTNENRRTVQDGAKAWRNGAPNAQTPEQRRAERERIWRDEGVWNPKWGLRPDEPGYGEQSA